MWSFPRRGGGAGATAPRLLARRPPAVVAVFAALILALSGLTGVASAQPAAAQIVDTEPFGEQHTQIHVYSPAMDRVVRLDVLHPKATTGERPTLYMLDGNGARDDQPHSSWIMRTDIKAFFAKKKTNVVLPVGGGGTFYTDWLNDDPVLGRNKWETFLTQELPPLVDAAFNGSGRNAVAGVSMGAQAATTLAFRHPDMYQALAAYSGCMYSSNLGQATVRSVVAVRGGNPNNMWGGPTNPEWPAHDPFQHLDKLEGKPVYVFTGRGVPGRADANFDPSFAYPADLAGAIALEQAIHGCTVLLQARLQAEGVKARVHYATVATHSWPYWQKALRSSWPTLRKGLGI